MPSANCRVNVLHVLIMKMIMAVAKSHLTRDKCEEKLVVVKAKKYEKYKIIKGQVKGSDCINLM